MPVPAKTPAPIDCLLFGLLLAAGSRAADRLLQRLLKVGAALTVPPSSAQDQAGGGAQHQCHPCHH